MFSLLDSKFSQHKRISQIQIRERFKSTHKHKNNLELSRNKSRNKRIVKQITQLWENERRLKKIALIHCQLTKLERLSDQIKEKFQLTSSVNGGVQRFSRFFVFFVVEQRMIFLVDRCI